MQERLLSLLAPVEITQMIKRLIFSICSILCVSFSAGPTGAEERFPVKLLAGVNAAVKGAPYPVALRLIEDFVVRGEDNRLVQVDARLVGHASGVELTSRVHIALKMLSLTFPDGTKKRFEVEGEVLGDDQQSGFAGTLIPPPATPIPDPSKLTVTCRNCDWVSHVRVDSGQTGVAVFRKFPTLDEISASLIEGERDSKGSSRSERRS